MCWKIREGWLASSVLNTRTEFKNAGSCSSFCYVTLPFRNFSCWNKTGSCFNIARYIQEFLFNLLIKVQDKRTPIKPLPHCNFYQCMYQYKALIQYSKYFHFASYMVAIKRPLSRVWRWAEQTLSFTVQTDSLSEVRQCHNLPSLLIRLRFDFIWLSLNLWMVIRFSALLKYLNTAFFPNRDCELKFWPFKKNCSKNNSEMSRSMLTK